MATYVVGSYSAAGGGGWTFTNPSSNVVDLSNLPELNVAIGRLVGLQGLDFYPSNFNTESEWRSFGQSLYGKTTEISNEPFTVFGTVREFYGRGGDGDDVFSVNNQGLAFVNGGNGNDYIATNFQASGDTTPVQPTNDQLYGGAGDDTLDGGPGNDYVEGGAGADVLIGGAGDDFFNEANNLPLAGTVIGGAGSDALWVSGTPSQSPLVLNYTSDTAGTISNATGTVTFSEVEHLMIAAGFGNDSIVAGAGNDDLNGRGGDDFLFGGAGNDNVNGDAGADTVEGGTGANTLFGNTGNDLLIGTAGSQNTFFAEPGDDIYDASASTDDLMSLNDLRNRYTFTRLQNGDVQMVNSFYGTDILKGVERVHFSDLGFVSMDSLFNSAPTAVNDTVQVNEDAQTASLWATLLGNDTDPDANDTKTILSVNATGTLGTIAFDADTQSLRFTADDDTSDLLATNATQATSFTYTMADASGLQSTATVNVTIRGAADGSTFTPGNGANNVAGTGGEDTVRAGNGNDTVAGGEGADSLQGENGEDSISGGNGRDRLFGDNGRDTLNGGAGNDTLDGGNDNDRLEGDLGADVYVFSNRRSADIDTIIGFDGAGGDRLDLANGVTYTASVANGSISVLLSTGARIELQGVSALDSGWVI